MENLSEEVLIKSCSYNEQRLLNIYESVKICESGCWEWTKSKDTNGYGRTWYGSLKYIGTYRKGWPAHRLIFFLLKGPIPNGYLVCHHCDNPPCCNINHLFLGTASDNCQDREKKKRGRTQNQNGEKNLQSKLTEKDVLLIRELYSQGIYAQELAKNFNVSFNHITRLVAKTRWNHI